MVFMADTIGPGSPIDIGGGFSGMDGPRWDVVGISAGDVYHRLRVVAHDEVPSGEAMSAALRYDAEAPEQMSGTMQHHLDAIHGTLPGVDPITVWAEDAAASDEEADLDGVVAAIDLPSSAVGLLYIPNDGQPGCMAWHEHAFAVVRIPGGLDRVLVVYGESHDARVDRAAADAFVRSHAMAGEPPSDHVMETSIEWFGFFGDNTIASSGSDGVPSPGRTGTTVEIETGGLPGVLALRAWQWLGSPLRRPRHDPLFQARLANQLRHLNGSPATPEVGDVAVWPSPTAVWIHGTVSCGLASDRYLDGLLPPPNQALLRYEHDTFLSIEKNVEDLARIISERAPAKLEQLLLVGHSRGGLVARGTANKLATRLPDFPVRVLTLGTPHLGTPIVNTAHRALRALVGITTFGISQLPDPASMLLKYVLRYARLPV
jgi:(2Fe-2S) ferredoxin